MPTTPFTHAQMIRRIDLSQFRIPKSKSPSWDLEREAVAVLGGETARAILAIFHARRDSQSLVFYVPQRIAAIYALDSTSLNRALSRLNGYLIEIIDAQRGKVRDIQLLPEWENPDAVEGDIMGNLRRDLRNARAAGMNVGDDNGQDDLEPTVRQDRQG